MLSGPRLVSVLRREVWIAQGHEGLRIVSLGLHSRFDRMLLFFFILIDKLVVVLQICQR